MTINLEKALIRQNKAVIAKDLLVMKEYEKLGSVPDSREVLQRLGMANSIVKAEGIIAHEAETLKEISIFNQERVFHVSQIEKLCEKYYLKFLPSKHFIGSIDPCLPNKVTTFEVAYGIDEKTAKYYIVAPASSFKLEPKPKDPLFFYKITDGYYYLVHKWGNDLNIFRRVLPILSKQWFFWTMVIPMSTASLNVFFNAIPMPKNTAGIILTYSFGYGVEFLISLFIAFLLSIHFDWDDLDFRFIKKNNCYSNYL